MLNENAVMSFLREFREEMSTRMDSLETRMDSLETRMDSLETRMDSLEKAVKENTKVLKQHTIEISKFNTSINTIFNIGVIAQISKKPHIRTPQE